MKKDTILSSIQLANRIKELDYQIQSGTIFFYRQVAIYYTDVTLHMKKYKNGQIENNVQENNINKNWISKI